MLVFPCKDELAFVLKWENGVYYSFSYPHSRPSFIPIIGVTHLDLTCKSLLLQTPHGLKLIEGAGERSVFAEGPRVYFIGSKGLISILNSNKVIVEIDGKVFALEGRLLFAKRIKGKITLGILKPPWLHLLLAEDEVEEAGKVHISKLGDLNSLKVTDNGLIITGDGRAIVNGDEVVIGEAEDALLYEDLLLVLRKGEVEVLDVRGNAMLRWKLKGDSLSEKLVIMDKPYVLRAFEIIKNNKVLLYFLLEELGV
ncbi:hypothetical protein IPA_07000 [Ignicoccus pacificus DSM 13166]|uniref:Uncharacterized protein n=1 Tax=Ignicoccus pacificus DSM 13166 TaxID=940294 RepID=A0A977PLS8_9CREN|nr:hypothetical protein IPA_07000 [Ignicoccus pacificus DSM 13166]